MRNEQQEMTEFFKGQGFDVEIHTVEDDVKVFQRLDVFRGTWRGSFLFVNGEQKNHSEIDRLRNKPTN
jgi:uncharacterized protein YgfB (UPF0149 family)